MASLADAIRDRYDLLGEIRPSALGISYRSAWDRETETQVMVKALRAAPAEPAARSFLLEGKTVATLAHPAVLRLLDVQVGSGWVWHVYETGRTRTLRDVLGDGRICTGDLLGIAWQLGQALEHLHQRGLTHGLLHPGNILIGDRGQVKLMGFGFGWDMRQALVPGYAAPETLSGFGHDRRTDVFAFGAVVFEMLAERPLVPQSTLRGAAAFHSSGSTPSLRRGPAWLRRLVLRCISASPTERPGGAAEVLLDLEDRVPTGGIESLRAPLSAVTATPWPAPLPALLGDLEGLRSPALAALRLIDLGEVLIKLAAVVGASAGGHSRLSLPSRPSLGHWCSSLRRGGAGCLPAGVVDRLQRLVHLRNRYKGHGALGEDDLYLRFLEEQAAPLLSVLEDGGMFSQLRWRDASLHLLDARLDVGSLIDRTVCPTCGQTEVFFFNSTTAATRTWLSYERGHSQARPAS